MYLFRVTLDTCTFLLIFWGEENIVEIHDMYDVGYILGHMEYLLIKLYCICFTIYMSVFKNKFISFYLLLSKFNVILPIVWSI